MTPVKRLLLIASKSGYQTAQFAAAAERQNIELRLATDRCHRLNDPWGDQALAIDFQRPMLAELPGADGIVAVGDQPAIVAATVAGMMGLRFHSASAVRLCMDKFAMRERLRLAGLLVPLYQRIGPADIEAPDVPFPCVLKPLSLSASRGVIRANTPSEFADAALRIRRMIPDGEFLQVEEFIPGREFAMEGVMTAGQMHVFTIFDKPDPLDGPFFEETIYTCPSREPAHIQSAILEAVRQSVEALGLSDGPVHAECRVNDRGVWMLEIAGRPIGGLCARVLQFESGRTLEDVIVRHAVGEPVTAEVLKPGGRAVMMIPIRRGGVYGGATGVEAALQVPGVESVQITAVAGQKLLPLPEGASYLGFIFAGEASAGQAEAAVRLAETKLHFEIQAALDVLK
jgi:biotin carboxylase